MAGLDEGYDGPEPSDRTRQQSFGQITRSGSAWWPKSILQGSEGQEPEATPKVQPTPLPKIRLLVLLGVQMVEALSITVLFPFIAFMILDFNITSSDEEVGYFAGLVASSYCAAQFFSSYWWGVASDRFGRRPILLSGMAGTIICNTAFGLSKTLPQALVTRSLAGLLCGNLGVVKSYVGEITDDSNQGRAFSLFGGAWGIATMVGPAIGGLLSRPAVKYPDTFGGTIFETYPYLLPMLTITLLAIGCFVVGACFLEETLGRSQSNVARKSSSKVDPLDSASDCAKEDVEMEALKMSAANGNGNGSTNGLGTANGHAKRLDEGMNGLGDDEGEQEDDDEILDRLAIQAPPRSPGGNKGQSPALAARTPSMLERLFGRKNFEKLEDVEGGRIDDPKMNGIANKVITRTNDTLKKVKAAGRESSSTKARKAYGRMTNTDDGDEDEIEVESADTHHKRCCTGSLLRPELKSRVVWTACGIYMLLGGAFIVFDEVFPVWASTAVANGGLGFNTSEIGYTQISGGVALLVFQFGLYNRLVDVLGVLPTHRLGFLFFIPVFCLVPFSHYIRDSDAATFGMLLVMVVMRSVGGSMAFTTSMTFINNSVTADKLASANGLGQSMVSLARTLGPPVGTAVYAQSLVLDYPFPFNFHFIFFAIGVISLITLLVGCTLPASIKLRKVDPSLPEHADDPADGVEVMRDTSV